MNLPGCQSIYWTTAGREIYNVIHYNHVTALDAMPHANIVSVEVVRGQPGSRSTRYELAVDNR